MLFVVFCNFLSSLNGELYYTTNSKVRKLFVKKLKEYEFFKKSSDINDIFDWFKNEIRKSSFFDERLIDKDCENVSQAFSSFNFCYVHKGDFERKTWLTMELLFDENLKFKKSDKDNIEELFPKVLMGLDFYLKNVKYEHLRQLKSIIIKACEDKNFFIGCK